MIKRFEDCSSDELAPFIDIRATRSSASELFIGEGIYIVRRMLLSSYSVKSLLVEKSSLEALVNDIPQDCHVIEATRSQIQNVVGFAFHRGVIACARRRPLLHFCISRAVETIAAWNKNHPLVSRPVRPVIPFLAGVSDPENVGSIVRSAAALGAPFMLLGPNTCDPFSRRVLRVSMGASLSLPLLDVTNQTNCLLQLREHQWKTVATTLSPNASKLQDFSISTSHDTPIVFLIGNEATGLPRDLEESVDHLLTIPMSPPVDSLNAGVAAAVFMHHLGSN